MSIVSEELLLDPATRVRMLSVSGSSVVVDSKIPALRYYRSGPQMEKMVCSCTRTNFLCTACLVPLFNRHSLSPHNSLYCRLGRIMLKDSWSKRSCCTTSLPRTSTLFLLCFVCAYINASF